MGPVLAEHWLTQPQDIPSNPAPPLSELDSPFQYAEYLSLKVRHDPHDIEDLVKLPTTDQDSPGASGSNGPRKGNERDLVSFVLPDMTVCKLIHLVGV